MATSNAFSGVGTQFLRSDRSSSLGTYSAVAEVNSISGPDKSRDTIDVTNLDSTGGYKEFIPSFRDAGQVVLNMNFTRAGYDDLNADFEVDASVAITPEYRIIFSDTANTQLDFEGWITNITINTPTDDKVTMDVTIKITGQVTLTS